MKSLLCLSLLLASFFQTSAQQKFTINGNIRDASNGESLIGATIFISELKSGAVTNEYGFHSITLAPGSYSIKFSYIGYEPLLRDVVLDKNQQLNIELAPE